MKKQKKSLSEQLGSIKGTFDASTNGSKVLGEQATFKNNTRPNIKINLILTVKLMCLLFIVMLYYITQKSAFCYSLNL